MQHHIRIIAGLAATAGVLLAGAAANPATADPAGPGSRPPAAAVTGEEFFAGLLLGHGPVAERFPDLAAGEAGSSAEADQLIEDVPAADPSFSFDAFGEAVTSGDRVKVDRALRAGAQALDNVLGEQPASGPIPDQAVACVVTCPQVLVVLLNPVVLYTGASSVPGDGLERDRWVNRIAGTLAS